MADRIHNLIANAGGRLRAAGVETPRVDAELLLAHVLGCSRSSLFLRRSEHLSDQVQAQYSALIDRRVAREPLQHITGHAVFCGVDLDVEPGVFIPRPETELLVEYVMSWLRPTLTQRISQVIKGEGDVGPVVVVDLCSGPATIIVGLAATITQLIEGMWSSYCLLHGTPEATEPQREFSGLGVRLVGVERSAHAVKVGRKNIESFLARWRQSASEAGMPGAVQGFVGLDLIQADVTDPGISQVVADAVGQGQAQVVVSNPPYVPEGAAVSPEVLADPHEAVFSGADGMGMIRTMMPNIARLAAPGALVAIEHDDSTSAAVARRLDISGFYDIEQHQDLAGRDRFVTAVLPGD